LDVFAQGAIRKIINLVRRRWKNFFILRSLECGPPIALGNALSFKDGVDRAETLRLLCHGIEKLAKEEQELFRQIVERHSNLSQDQIVSIVRDRLIKEGLS
jgi:hypothetical protein